MATQLAERRAHPVQVFSQALDLRHDQLKMALPAHIPVDRFKRVAITAVQNNPDLLDGSKVNQGSLFLALIKSASDGLLPDGREAAIVPFKGRASYMPMVHGIMKKVRNSGEIASWEVAAVFEKDKFQRLLGDDQRLFHEPHDAGDPGEVVGAYSIVTFKDGTKSRDYMPRWRIEKARNCGLAKNSLQWTTFYDEGAIKTVVKHHAKRLPQSTDVEALFERDDMTREPQAGDDAPAAEERTLRPVPERVPVSRMDALEQQITHQPSSAGDGSADGTAEGSLDGAGPEARLSEHQDHGDAHDGAADRWIAKINGAELASDVERYKRQAVAEIGEDADLIAAADAKIAALVGGR